jgi:hypothetical protein
MKFSALLNVFQGELSNSIRWGLGKGCFLPCFAALKGKVFDGKLQPFVDLAQNLVNIRDMEVPSDEIEASRVRYFALKSIYATIRMAVDGLDPHLKGEFYPSIHTIDLVEEELAKSIGL